jgi:hypothetical protein
MRSMRLAIAALGFHSCHPAPGASRWPARRQRRINTASAASCAASVETATPAAPKGVPATSSGVHTAPTSVAASKDHIGESASPVPRLRDRPVHATNTKGITSSMARA